MKRITLLIALSFLFILSQAQYSTFNYEKSTSVFDTNLITHNPIQADCYSFPYSIEYTHYDSATKTVLIVLSGRASVNVSLAPGTIVLLDLDKHNVRWTEDEDLTNSNFNITDKAVIEFNSKELIGQSLRDGQLLWRHRSKPILYSLENNIALMPVCEKKDCSDSIFEAISLIDGKPLWQIKLDSKHSLLPSHKVNDSIWIINGQGITAFNKNKGELWRFPAKTDWPSVTSFNKSDFVDLYSFVPVSFDGYVKEPDLNVLSGIQSSILQDSLDVYYATKDKLVSIRYLNGSIRWEAPLNNYLSSYSTILDADSLIIMINSGMAFMYGFKSNEYIHGTVHHGKPFISAYRKTDGKLLYMNEFNEKDAVLIDQRLMHDTLVIMLKNGIDMYSAQYGTLIDSMRMSIANTDGFKILSGKFIYFEKDKKIVRVQDYFPHYLLVRSNNDMIFMYDKKLNFKGYIVPNIQYLEIDTSSCYKILLKDPASTKNPELFLTDKSNRIICKLENISNISMKDDKLFVTKRKELFVIDLSKIQ